VVEAEQLELPVPKPADAVHANGEDVVGAVLNRMAAIRPRLETKEPARAVAVELSFSQLQAFEICPVRYRFSQVWGVPAPPDDLLDRWARTEGSTELGAAVHAALEAWHSRGGDLLRLYSGPESGAEMLRRYLTEPLASAETLGVEVEFNLRLGKTQLDKSRVRGVVDRICVLDGKTVLVDYKTTATIDAPVMAAYTTQLRLYGLAAQRGLLPGGSSPRLVLFDLRRGRAIEVTPDVSAVEARVAEVAARIKARDFALGPEHANRPCAMCAYRPICADARRS